MGEFALAGADGEGLSGDEELCRIGGGDRSRGTGIGVVEEDFGIRGVIFRSKHGPGSWMFGFKAWMLGKRVAGIEEIESCEPLCQIS